MPYDTLRDLAPIVLIAKSASCLCAHPSLPVKGVKDFIPVRASAPGPNQLRHARRRHRGSPRDRAFSTEAGVKLNHVPYKGAAQYTVDLLAGNIEVAINQFAIAAPLVKQGKVRCLGVTSLERTPLLPDVPTIAEQGLKGFSSYNWNGLLAPAATPRAVITRVHEVIAKALKTPEAREHYASQGHEIGGLNPDEYTAFIREETQQVGASRAESGNTEAMSGGAPAMGRDEARSEDRGTRFCRD